MEEKKTPISSFSLSSSPSPLPPLTTTPSSSPPSPPPPLSQPESFSETSEPDSDPSPLSLPLHHHDAFSFNQTPSQLFHLRLRRDSFRFNSLTSLAYNRTRPGPPSSRFSSSIVSGLSQGNDEYFTGIGVGSPPITSTWSSTPAPTSSGSNAPLVNAATPKPTRFSTRENPPPSPPSLAPPLSAATSTHPAAAQSPKPASTKSPTTTAPSPSTTSPPKPSPSTAPKSPKSPSAAATTTKASSSALSVRLAEGPIKLESIELVSQSWFLAELESQDRSSQQLNSLFNGQLTTRANQARIQSIGLPKKLKLPNGSAKESLVSSLKKQKTPISKITTRALDLLNECKGTDYGNDVGTEGKKKRGRLVGSKNIRNSHKEKKTETNGGGSMQPSKDVL
ncbi:hypothetical protein ACLB2K_068775 [Fragaria x ananassa]